MLKYAGIDPSITCYYSAQGICIIQLTLYILKYWHCYLVRVVKITSRRLNAVSASAKDAIPHPCLLAIIETLPPALAMVQVMILAHKVHTERFKEPNDGRGRREISPDTTMPPNLRIHHVLVAYPPFMESKRQAHSPERHVGQERHANHIKEFLLVISIGCHKRVRVFS